jgi:hypothetical protein
MLGRKAQSGRTRQGPPAVWPSRRIEGPWLRARCRKSGGTRYLGIGRPCLLEDARPHHHPGRNRPLPKCVATPMGADGRLPCPTWPPAVTDCDTAHCDISAADERRVAFRGRGRSHRRQPARSLDISPAMPVWLRRPALAACIDYLGPPALCVAAALSSSRLGVACPKRPF